MPWSESFVLQGLLEFYSQLISHRLRPCRALSLFGIKIERFKAKQSSELLSSIDECSCLPQLVTPSSIARSVLGRRLEAMHFDFALCATLYCDTSVFRVSVEPRRDKAVDQK